jgi:hypothetical protein
MISSAIVAFCRKTFTLAVVMLSHDHEAAHDVVNKDIKAGLQYKKRVSSGADVGK